MSQVHPIYRLRLGRDMKYSKLWLKIALLAGPLWIITFAGVSFQTSAPAEPLSVMIIRPGEGETIYAGPQTMLYSIFITGQVHISSSSPDQSELKLEILSSNVQIGSYTSHPTRNGSFSIPVTVNPDTDSQELTNGLPVDRNISCQTACHFATQLSLKPGIILIRVTVTTPDGQQAISERHISVDRAGYALIPVRVVLADDGVTPVSGVPVTGGARLYLWRTRYTTAITGADGYTMLRVEALAEAPTHYVLKVEPSVVNGEMYESVDSVEITLSEGASAASLVTLHVRSKLGQISGQAAGLVGTTRIRAVHLPDYASYTQDTSGYGKFSFKDIPIGRYLLIAGGPSVAGQAYQLVTQAVDLTDTTHVIVTLPMKPVAGVEMVASVKAEQDAWLPFAWVTSVNGGTTFPALPDSGNVQVDSAAGKSLSIEVSAPGFYSQAQVFESVAGRPLVFNLVRRPDTQVLAWGTGEILIPAETQAVSGDHQISLGRGWLWGNGGDGQPFQIKLNAFQIEIKNGRFALESTPGQSTWFYLFEGQAELKTRGAVQPIGQGQMVALGESIQPHPVAYDPVIFQALHLLCRIPQYPSPGSQRSKPRFVIVWPG
jgi:hypothetical protein